MSEQPKMLTERISFIRKPDELTVVITQEIPRAKEAMLFAWLCAWALVGGVFIYYWRMAPAAYTDRIFFAISTAFWLYFFVRTIKVWLWRRIGKELLRIHGETLSIKDAYGKWGKARMYTTDQVRKFGVVPYDFTKFGQFMDRSFWVIGGESLGFEYRGKKIVFGKQLSDRDALQLARIIEKALREIPARARREEKEQRSTQDD